MNLRSKIHLYTAVVFFLLLTLMNASIYFVTHRLLVDNVIASAEEETVLIGRSLLDTLQRGDVPLKNLLRAHVPVDGMIRLVTDDPALDLPSVTSGSATRLGATRHVYYPDERSDRIAFEDAPYVFVSIPLIWTDGSIVNLQLTQSTAAVDHMLAVLRIVLVSVTLLAMIPVFLSSRLLGNFIARPVHSMIDTMRDIQQSGQLKRITLEAKTGDELVVMGRTFNHMIDLLQENMARQEQFVSNASHELKTPLTVIESYASLLKRRGREQPELYEESVDAIYSEAVRMREMTEQLLLLAKNPEHWNIDKQPVSLTAFAEELATIYQKAYNRNVNIRSREDIEVITDEQKLKQMVFIFLDNARKFSEDDIDLFVGQSGDETYIRIEDHGIGIPKEDLPNVFDRFYRVDQAGGRKLGGSGLGLSVAREIADALDMRLEMDALEGRGTSITIFMPNSSFSHDRDVS